MQTVPCFERLGDYAVDMADVAVEMGAMAEVIIDVVGDGLTYEWYYKNADASEFALTGSFTGNTYAVEMNESRAGRQIYCVITDANGNSVTTDTVTLNLKTNAPVIVTQPASVTVEAGAMVSAE